MRRTDIRAVADLGGEAFAAGAEVVQAMHEGIAQRPFGILGPAAAPVRVVHDRVAASVYAGVRAGLRAGGRAGGLAAAAGASDEGPALASTPRGAMALGVLNGLCGDHLTARRTTLAVPMDVRRHGADVPATRLGLAAAYPDAASRIAVFVHGLCGDDDCWRIFPLRGRTPGRRTYGERLQDELGFTPVHVRYNTGLRVSDNGRALAELLDDVAANWPVGVEEVVLIGHSMGGLVARSACHAAEADRRRWARAVRHVVCLGSPHLGADAEKGLNALGHALGRLPETRALAKVVNARSVGIKDLRFGSCAEEDWRDRDPDEFLRDRCAEVPFLPGAHFCFVGATLAAGPVGALLGDLLVRMPSASGRGTGTGRRIPFEVDNGRELTGVDHFELLNHPAVYDQLRAWIEGGRAARDRARSTN